MLPEKRKQGIMEKNQEQVWGRPDGENRLIPLGYTSGVCEGRDAGSQCAGLGGNSQR